MPRSTLREKIRRIEFYGGKFYGVDGSALFYEEAQRLARECNGHYMDQFTYPERATDWRGNNNIAELIFEQMALDPDPVLWWLLMGAGTGGTSATIGRYIRYTCRDNQLCVVDPSNSVFFDFYTQRRREVTILTASRIEAIGCPRVEPSCLSHHVIDRMIRVPNTASFAAMHVVKRGLATVAARLAPANTASVN